MPQLHVANHHCITNNLTGMLSSNTMSTFLLWWYHNSWQGEVIRVCDHKEIREQLHQIIWKAKGKKFISSHLLLGWLSLSFLFNSIYCKIAKFPCHSSLNDPWLQSRITNERCERITIFLLSHTKSWKYLAPLAPQWGETYNLCISFKSLSFLAEQFSNCRHCRMT